MHLTSTNISCGIKNLVFEKLEKVTKKKIKSTLALAQDNCAIVMASIPRKNSKRVSLLKQCGFKEFPSSTTKHVLLTYRSKYKP